MNRPNTRTIGINTDINLVNIRCIKCLQDNNCAKFAFIPCYFPFAYPVCNSMLYSQFQNNFSNYSNISTNCENQIYLNSCNSHHCLQNCSSSLSTICKNCGSKSSCNENEHLKKGDEEKNIRNQMKEENQEMPDSYKQYSVHLKKDEEKNISLRSSRIRIKEESKDETSEAEEKRNISLRSSKHRSKEDSHKEIPNSYEEKTNVPLRSSMLRIKEESPKDMPSSYESEEISNSSNITKYANEFLEKNYRYVSKSRTETENIEEDSEIHNQNNDEKLITRLLKPNHRSTVEENDDSDINIDSENEAYISDDTQDDEFSGITVIRPTQSENNDYITEDRRPTRININNSSSRPQMINKDDGMLLMIQALVNNPYDNSNSPPLNRLLNHIGSENPGPKSEFRKSNSSSPRIKVTNYNYGTVMTTLNENKN